ncbi:hypothetical protein C8J57DRAFT_1212029 [Mycena rebaudengoi]|nr:hypothetical protein C8J57DRAFT_1212029 [Mycena rebaudengoi]
MAASQHVSVSVPCSSLSPENVNGAPRGVRSGGVLTPAFLGGEEGREDCADCCEEDERREDGDGEAEGGHQQQRGGEKTSGSVPERSLAAKRLALALTAPSRADCVQVRAVSGGNASDALPGI